MYSVIDSNFAQLTASLASVPLVINSQRKTAVTTANKVSYVMPANTLSTDSMALRIFASGRSVTGTTNLELDFGATQVISTVVQNNDLFTLEGVVRRTGAASQVAEAQIVPQLTTYKVQSASPAETLSSAVTITLWTTGAVTCTVDHFQVDLIPAV